MLIGFACQWLTPDREGKTEKELKDIESPFRCTTTTVKWCTENKKDYQEKLWSIMEHNLLALLKLTIKVSSDPDPMKRMVRLSSDVLPLFTYEPFAEFYRRADVIAYLEKKLPAIGKFAESKKVRLSFHPSQICVLASENPNTVENSIKEFEYHAFLVRCMGLGKEFQDFKCNVHLSGKGGESVFRKTYSRLSDVAKNILTIENDEFSSGLDEALAISDLVPIVLDVHHHWINTGGYIKPTDSRVQRIIDSWRGIRPVMHYSYSRSEFLTNHLGNAKPNYFKLGVQDRYLRQHSDDYPNVHSNRWALSFLSDFDIMCEAKLKNIARDQIVDQYYKENQNAARDNS